jgi:putative transposase
MRSRKIRGHFPSDEAAGKLLYLALRNAVLRLGRPKGWMLAMQHITLLFGDRVPGEP